MPGMIENYKEKMADVIAMLDRQEEIRKDAISKGQKMHEVEAKAKGAVNQKALDEVFQAYMNKEYTDEKIGDLEGDEGIDPLAFIEGEEGEEGEDGEQDFYDYGSLSDGDGVTPSMMSQSAKMTSNADMLEAKLKTDNHMIGEAVDEFIQDKKLWFRTLAREYEEDIETKAIEKGNNFLEGTVLNIGKCEIPVDGQLDPEGPEYKKMLFEKSIAIEAIMQEEADARDPDYITPDTSEDEAEKWDAETILSTYSNLDNHPGIIKYVPKSKNSNINKIILDKQFKVPIDGLSGLIPIAEEVEKKKQKKLKLKNQNRFEEATSSDEDEDQEGEESEGSIKELNPRKAAKKLVKAERKEKRKQKKELKVAFKTHHQKIHK